MSIIQKLPQSWWVEVSFSFFELKYSWLTMLCWFQQSHSIIHTHTLFFRFLLEVACNGTLLQYSCLENPMDGGAWRAAVHGVAESRAQLSDFTFPCHFHSLEKEMTTHSSMLAWEIPWTEEPRGLQFMGLPGVWYNWVTKQQQNHFIPTMMVMIF